MIPFRVHLPLRAWVQYVVCVSDGEKKETMFLLVDGGKLFFCARELCNWATGMYSGFWMLVRESAHSLAAVGVAVC